MKAREGFEALPEIIKRVNALEFNDYTKEYESSLMFCSNKAYVNGAWMAFQEQEKKLKELEEALTDVQYMCHKSISFEHDLFDKGWNQASRQTVINIHRLTGIGERLLNESKPQ